MFSRSRCTRAQKVDGHRHAGDGSRAWLAFTCAVAAVLLAGCARRADVVGKVTYEGEPLTSGNVKLYASDGVPRDASINADGTYRFREIPYGPARFAVYCMRAELVEHMQQLAGRGGRGGEIVTTPDPEIEPEDFSIIPLRYSDPQQSGLTLEVDGPRCSFDLKLESATN